MGMALSGWVDGQSRVCRRLGDGAAGVIGGATSGAVASSRRESPRASAEAAGGDPARVEEGAGVGPDADRLPFFLGRCSGNAVVEGLRRAGQPRHARRRRRLGIIGTTQAALGGFRQQRHHRLQFEFDRRVDGGHSSSKVGEDDVAAVGRWSGSIWTQRARVAARPALPRRPARRASTRWFRNAILNIALHPEGADAWGGGALRALEEHDAERPRRRRPCTASR